jgi:hypothetical protein
MKLEERLLVDDVLKRMRSVKPTKGSGEISFDTLASISREREGWVGALLQELLHAIESDEGSIEAEKHLMDLAAVALSWAQYLRKNRLDISQLPKAGDAVVVRVPEHRLRYLGTVTEEGKIYIAFLQKLFTLADVEIIPEKKKNVNPVARSLDFQHAINNQMEFLRTKVFEEKS